MNGVSCRRWIFLPALVLTMPTLVTCVVHFVPLRFISCSCARFDKTRQDKTIQDKTRQHKTRLCYISFHWGNASRLVTHRYKGGDALNVILNTVAMLFMVEMDEIAYLYSGEY